MKVCVVCHGNIARSQVLHHYVDEYARQAGLSLDLFSCGTAPRDAYPDADRLLAEVRTELAARGLSAPVERNVLDDEARQRLAAADLVVVADAARRQDVLAQLGDSIEPQKLKLFYEFIGEGQNDFVDTYDAEQGAQDPERFANCFNELERIAKLTVERLQKSSAVS